MKINDLKEYGKSIFDGRNLYGYGKVRLATHYYKSLIESHSQGRSILDIGCGDGIIGKIVGDDVEYRGLDIGAGIYDESDSSKISYIRDYAELLSAIESSQIDISLLINVLEHTFDFTDLFEKALENTTHEVPRADKLL